MVAVVASLIALFTRLQVLAYNGVATHSFNAVVSTRIVVGTVAIVAGLIPLLTLLDVLPAHAVTAAGDLTIVTTVRIDLIGVVTGFVAFLPLLQVLATDSIATTGYHAVGHAGIALHVVAVIASFIALLP